MIRIFVRKLLDTLPYISRRRKLLRETGEYPPRHYSSPVPGCPRCGGSMTFQRVQSIGAGAARVYNVEVYLCPKCGCKGRYDEKALKIIEIK